MTGLPQKILELHRALNAKSVPHAFGGALALAWCTQQARGTIDIDINIFVAVDQAVDVFESLPDAVTWDDDDLSAVVRDGQVRLWWDTTPVDVFLNTTPFHDRAALRIRWEPFGDADLPFLSCDDLAVFKAFFNRTKDWADLEAMVEVESLDVDRVVGVLVRYLGADDERITRLAGLA